MNAVAGRIDAIGLADDLPAGIVKPFFDRVGCVLGEITLVLRIARFDMENRDAPAIGQVLSSMRT